MQKRHVSRAPKRLESAPSQRRGSRDRLWDDALVPSDSDARTLSPSREGATETLLGESRWPPVAAVVGFMVLNIALRVWLPKERPVDVPWLIPAIEASLLVVLLTSDPSGLAERRRLRRLSLLIVGILVAAALWATALLVDSARLRAG